MKKLLFILSSIFLLSACDPTFRVQEGSQSGGSGNVVAGKDVTYLMVSFFKNNSYLVRDCQPFSTSPALWVTPRYSMFGSFMYSGVFYTDSSCDFAYYQGDLGLEFDVQKILTTEVEDEYLMELELINASLFVYHDGSPIFDNLHDFTENIGESFYWKVKIDPGAIDSETRMPSPNQLELPSSELEPIEASEMYRVERGG